MADGLLRQGWYEPQPSLDVWALGLLMLDVIGIARPEGHLKLCSGQDYHNEVCKSSNNLDNCPAMREYYMYLQRFLPGNGQPSYEEQVSLLLCVTRLA